MAEAFILWRRLDTPGHDACRLDRGTTGWRLQGAAVFQHEGVAASLAYHVACDLAWRTQRATIQGWLGGITVGYTVQRTDNGAWTVNGAEARAPSDCIDLDLGFTPATNLLPIRRLALEMGQAADAPAAWLDVAAGTLALLPQRYERRTEATYWYESPSTGYTGLLEVAPSGFVQQYPQLWEAVQT